MPGACRKCGKKPYVPSLCETVGAAKEYLKARGWTYDTETWSSNHGGRKEEEHWFCPNHTWEDL